jgi:hypothetical protein
METINANRILVGKPLEKGSSERLRWKLKDTVKMNIRWLGFEDEK